MTKIILGGLDVIKSKVLLLDLCPFMAVALPIFLIFDRKRKWVGSIVYLSIIGGGITIFGQITFEQIGPDATNSSSQSLQWWQYIFLNKLYFAMHFYIFIMSVIVIMNSKSLNKERLIFAHLFTISYFVYITICVFSLKISRNATGIVINDWLPSGQYEKIGGILKLPWPWQPIIAFSIGWLLVMLMMSLRNIMVINKQYVDDHQIEIPFFREKFILFYNHFIK